MKRKIIIIFISVLKLCIFMSCNSTKKDIAFYNTEILKINNVEMGNIDISINHVNDEELKHQIQNEIELKLHSFRKIKELNQKKTLEEPFLENEKLFFNIKINERSINENFDIKNSIFIYSSITDINSRVIYENCFYAKSGSTILSSHEQHKYINIIFSDLEKLING